MKEVIILEIKEPRKSQLVQDFLKSKKVDYKVLVETQLEQAYQEAYSDKERERECQIWDTLETEEWND